MCLLTRLITKLMIYQDEATVAYNKFQKSQLLETQKYDWSDFDTQYKRQFEKMAVIGMSALDTEDEELVFHSFE